MTYQIDCHEEGCEAEGVEFFEVNDDFGYYLCWPHYGKALDRWEQAHEVEPPLDSQGRKMWFDPDTLTWQEVR